MERATASRRGGRIKTPIEEIPAFRTHLAREGITFAQWEAQQPKPDPTSEALSLARRKVMTNKKGTK